MSEKSKREGGRLRSYLFTRRDFILTSFLLLSTKKAISQKNPEKKEGEKKLLEKYDLYIDEKTGATIYKIVTGPSRNTTIYQTHPMWGRDNKHFYFLSDRSGEGMRLHRLELSTGKTEPMLEKDARDFCLTWKSELIFFMKENKIIRQDVWGKQTEFALLPASFGNTMGGLAVSIDDQWLYCGTYKEGDEYHVLRRLNLNDGMWEECARVPFQIGHVQTNLWNPELVMFCWETGGDSPQRTWCWSEKTRKAEPFFVEHDELWITHEVWWGNDRILFTIWPYDEKHKQLPHGVAETNREQGVKGEMEILATYPAWHTHGSHDYRWVLGDDFDRNIWLISYPKKERRLLVSGKQVPQRKVHPHASFLPDSSGIVFNSSRFGSEEIHLVRLPDIFDSLPLPLPIT